MIRSGSMLVIAGYVISASPVMAQNLVDEIIHDTQKIQLYDDGTWRYHPDAGLICTPLGETLEACAVTHDWYRIPSDPGSAAIKFASPAGFTAEVIRFPQEANFGSSQDEREDTMERMITGMATENGLQALVLGRGNSSVLEQTAKTVLTQGGSHVRAFTYLISEDVTILIQTKYAGTVMHDDHQARHMILLNSIQLAGQE